MIAPIVQEQLAELRSAAGEAANWQERPEGSIWVEVPQVALPAGWNKPSCTIHFLAPIGYPQARPDCFYADSDLRLSSGGLPANANVQGAPSGQVLLWFSYHVSQWDPQRDTLATYLNVCKQRLRDLR